MPEPLLVLAYIQPRYPSSRADLAKTDRLSCSRLRIAGRLRWRGGAAHSGTGLYQSGGWTIFSPVHRQGDGASVSSAHSCGDSGDNNRTNGSAASRDDTHGECRPHTRSHVHARSQAHSFASACTTRLRQRRGRAGSTEQSWTGGGLRRFAGCARNLGRYGATHVER